jgi:hypothetical protein
VFNDIARGDFAACRYCPEGADCPAQSNMSISPRYYAVRNATTMVVQTFLCAGGRCAADGACGSNRLPAAQNPLCGACHPGHSEWNGSCVACPGVNAGLVFGLLLLAWLVVLVLHFFSQSVSGSSALRITMYMWQVALLVVGRAAWLRWAAFLDLNFFAANGGSVCPFPVSPVGMLFVLLLGPLLVFVMLGATAALHFLVRRDAAVDEPRGGLMMNRLPPFDVASYARTALSLYFFTFNQIVRQCLELFSCVELSDGSSYMASLPAVRCDSGSHRAVTPIALFLLLVYVFAAPGFMLFKLWSFHRQGRLGDADVARWWGVVYAPFRESAF